MPLLVSILRIKQQNIHFAELQALRPSLFPHVPPFLNFIPGPNGTHVFPPAKMRDQLWRIPQSIGYMITQVTNKL